ncbi:EPIDERMAL PATTERNING FACTOR-like protein 5 [Trifolium pratense]|uniref:EPIDERMAL PATTERNING FACTOR-like protein 5 n=1 Tax=Trifolium pratense TaxID=57577 RepID=UPI001E6960EC|nr:EPIDERMAL PATTERNING FACTOR-like protein 5 [Trifolium pratense]
MAPLTRSYHHLHGLKLATIIIITVLFIFFFSISGGSVVLERNESLEERKMIGSKPPVCLNKCLNCRPCIATLVVPNKQKIIKSFKVLSRGDQDDTYYLLAWKCSCGNKLFQP